MTKDRPLRVGVLSRLRFTPGLGTSTATMWGQVLPPLARMTELRVVDDPQQLGDEDLVDVWLGNGQAGPLPVRQTQVLQIHEASWAMPHLVGMARPEFVSEMMDKLKASVAAAERIITLSESSRRQIVEELGADPKRVRPVPLGVDAEVFRPGLGRGRLVVQRCGGTMAPYVLFVSVLHPRKNLTALRHAMQALARRGFPHQLVVVARRPWDGSDITELGRHLLAPLDGVPNRVVRVGPLTDEGLAAVMAGAAVFCLPSLMEGFGLTALEAMACGVPVVVSDRGALPEVVGDAGIVVPPTPDALEDAIGGLLADPDRAAALGRAGRERAEGFTWDRTANGWLAVLREAVI